MNTNGQSDTNTTDNDEFSSISTALAKGDFESLDRLMADKGQKDENVPLDDKKDETDTSVEEVTDDSAAVKTDETDDTDSEDKGNKDLSDDGVESKEAAPAASPPEDRVKELEQELHRLRSDAGRVPFLQRRLSEVERQLRASKARTVDGSTDGKASASVSVDPTSVELDPETQKVIDEFKESDPALARAFERVARSAIAAANSRVDTAVTNLTAAEQEEDDYRFLMEQKSELLRTVPQADQVFASQEWKQWKERLTPGQRAMAESAYAADVTQAIYAFAADMQRLYNGTPAASASNPPAVTPPKNSEVAEARARKSTAVDSKNTAPKTAVEFDEQAYFKEMYKKAGKDNHIL